MQHTKGASQKTNKVLDARQKHLLNKWIESKIVELKGKTREEISVIASDELSFDVSASSITTALKATGLLIRGIPKQEKHRKNMAALLDTIKMLCEKAEVPFNDILKAHRAQL